MRFLTLLPLLAISAMAGNPLTYQVEHINLPNEKAVELIHAKISGKSDPWEMVKNWKKDGIATSASGSLVTAVTSSEPPDTTNSPWSSTPPGFGYSEISGHVEWLFATEFDPVEIPLSIEVTDKFTIQDFIISPITPTAFETRNIGTGYEFKNVSETSTGNVWEINTYIAQNFGTETIGQGESQCWMPKFHQREQNQLLKPHQGEWMLLSATEAGPSDPDITTTTWLRLLNTSTSIPETQSTSSDRNLNLLAEWYVIEPSAVEDWLKNLTADPDNSALHTALQDLVTAGKAQSISKRLLITRSGKSTESEGEKEIVFGTEYEPPQINHPETDQPDSIRVRNSPTAFETRKLGTSITVEPVVLSDSRFIECGVNAQTVDHDIDHNMGSLKASIYMPFLISTHIQTRTVLENGKPRLIGVTSKPVRSFPAADINRSTDIEDPPKYQLHQTPRTVLFLTAKIEE